MFVSCLMQRYQQAECAPWVYGASAGRRREPAVITQMSFQLADDKTWLHIKRFRDAANAFYSIDSDLLLTEAKTVAREADVAILKYQISWASFMLPGMEDNKVLLVCDVCLPRDPVMVKVSLLGTHGLRR